MVSCNQTPHIVKGTKMCNGKYHKVWATNFNMPVSCLFTGDVQYNDYPNGFVCTFCNIMDQTSTAVGANLCDDAAGFELGESVVIFWWQTQPGEYVNGNVCLRQCWVRDGVTFISAASPINVNMGAPDQCWRTFYENHYMTGVDSDEVCCDAPYCAVTRGTYISGDNLSVANCAIDLCWGDVPSTGRCSSTIKGSIWVEGNDLHFINSNGWEHSMIGYVQGDVGGSEGAIWIDNSHYLRWVGANGCCYRAQWRICQFCSTFSNGPGPNPSPGAGYKGALWADNEFGETHLAYIGCDGHKYITGSGRDPNEGYS